MDHFVGRIRCRPRLLCVAKHGRFLATILDPRSSIIVGTAFYPHNVQCRYEGDFTTGCGIDGGLNFQAADPRDLICGPFFCMDSVTGQELRSGTFAVKRQH
jgi:hypothetical protein